MSMRVSICSSLRASRRDPHYGKTMRGVLRYRREDVVAILDSTRARARRRTACPIVAQRRGGAPARADDGARRGRDAGRVLPARVDGAPPDAASSTGSTSRTASTSSSPTIPSCARSPRSAASSCATCAGRRPGLSTATGENLAVDATIVLTVGSDCAIGKMTVSCELDLEARRRGRPLGLRPDRADGHRDRRLGDRGRRGRRRLHRRRRRAARRRGARSAAASCSGSRARARSCTRSTPA